MLKTKAINSMQREQRVGADRRTVEVGALALLHRPPNRPGTSHPLTVDRIAHADKVFRTTRWADRTTTARWAAVVFAWLT